MTIFVGETFTVIGDARNPARGGAVISDAVASVEFYAIGSNPSRVPTDRTVVYGPYPMTFDVDYTLKDGTVGAYIANVDSNGWAAGKYPFRVLLSGLYDSWEYGHVTVSA